MATKNDFCDLPQGGLYTCDELLNGLRRDDPMSYLETWDFRVFRRFVIHGGTAPTTLGVRQQQAEHDAHISNALRQYLESHKRLVGIMGGHSVVRATAPYVTIARLTYLLA